MNYLIDEGILKMDTQTEILEEKKNQNLDFSLFSNLESYGHEEIVICSRPEVGLKAIIAIHDTTLGPSLGGTRMWPYESEEAAMKDVLRLSRGMTYKSAISGLNLGGGKAVIIGDPQTDKSEMLFRAFGRFVDGLGGRYITAEDVGMTELEMEWIYSETKYVTGIPKSLGGSGNPSPVTAYGVYMGMKASAKKAYGSDSLKGKKVAVQGAGNVASHLARFLSKEGAEIYITDIFKEKAKKVAEEVSGTFVDPDDIYDVDMDIFSPCALGGVINDKVIPRLSCDIVAGAANNILDDEVKHGEDLIDRGILYAPDYVINAGGVINISSELEGYDEDRAMQKTERIYDTVLDIFDYAEENSVTPVNASNRLAEERIESVKNLKSIYSSKSGFSGRNSEIYMRDRK